MLFVLNYWLQEIGARKTKLKYQVKVPRLLINIIRITIIPTMATNGAISIPLVTGITLLMGRYIGSRSLFSETHIWTIKGCDLLRMPKFNNQLIITWAKIKYHKTSNSKKTIWINDVMFFSVFKPYNRLYKLI